MYRRLGRPTQNAFKHLFKGICVILCFLHSVLKIAQRCVRDRATRAVVLDKAWAIYHAKARVQISQRVRRFREWGMAKLPEGGLRDIVVKLCSKKAQFLKAYDHPRAHRTSNAIDRLIDSFDRRLFAMRKLRGTPASGRRAVRSMALQWNLMGDPPAVLRAVRLWTNLTRQEYLLNLQAVSDVSGCERRERTSRRKNGQGEPL